MICCSCNYRNHIKCDEIDNNEYLRIKNSKDPHLCKICKDDAIPFQNLSDDEYLAFDKGIDLTSYDALKLIPNFRMKTLFKNLNAYDDDIACTTDDDVVGVNCKYYQVDDISKNNFRKESKLSLMHLNIASLNAHKDELDDLLSILNLKLDIIGLSETKIIKGINPTYDPRLSGYNEFLKPTESEKGGTALYINENIQNTQRKDLEALLYFPKLLESTFAEITTSSKVPFTNTLKWILMTLILYLR